MNIRIRFGKEGMMRYIGHLDVLRTFQKIFRRAGVPMIDSNGYSPHPVMSFALPPTGTSRSVFISHSLTFSAAFCGNSLFRP